MIRIMKYGEVPNSEIFARNMPTMNVTDKVAEILRNVRERGDEALRENNLAVIEEIVPISARLIANKSGFKFRTEQIERLTEGLRKEVQEA